MRARATLRPGTRLRRRKFTMHILTRRASLAAVLVAVTAAGGLGLAQFAAAQSADREGPAPVPIRRHREPRRPRQGSAAPMARSPTVRAPSQRCPDRAAQSAASPSSGAAHSANADGATAVPAARAGSRAQPRAGSGKPAAGTRAAPAAQAASRPARSATARLRSRRQAGRERPARPDTASQRMAETSASAGSRAPSRWRACRRPTSSAARSATRLFRGQNVQRIPRSRLNVAADGRQPHPAQPSPAPLHAGAAGAGRRCTRPTAIWSSTTRSASSTPRPMRSST